MQDAVITCTDDLPPPCLHPSPVSTFGAYKFRAFVCRILGEKDVRLALRSVRRQFHDSSISYAFVLEDYRTLTDEARRQGVSESSIASSSPVKGLKERDPPLPDTSDGDEPGSGLKLLSLLHVRRTKHCRTCAAIVGLLHVHFSALPMSTPLSLVCVSTPLPLPFSAHASVEHARDRCRHVSAPARLVGARVAAQPRDSADAGRARDEHRRSPAVHAQGHAAGTARFRRGHDGH